MPPVVRVRRYCGPAMNVGWLIRSIVAAETGTDFLLERELTVGAGIRIFDYATIKPGRKPSYT